MDDKLGHDFGDLLEDLARKIAMPEGHEIIETKKVKELERMLAGYQNENRKLRENSGTPQRKVRKWLYAAGLAVVFAAGAFVFRTSGKKENTLLNQNVPKEEKREEKTTSFLDEGEQIVIPKAPPDYAKIKEDSENKLHEYETEITPLLEGGVSAEDANKLQNISSKINKTIEEFKIYGEEYVAGVKSLQDRIQKALEETKGYLPSNGTIIYQADSGIVMRRNGIENIIDKFQATVTSADYSLQSGFIVISAQTKAIRGMPICVLHYKNINDNTSFKELVPLERIREFAESQYQQDKDKATVIKIGSQLEPRIRPGHNQILFLQELFKENTSYSDKYTLLFDLDNGSLTKLEVTTLCDWSPDGNYIIDLNWEERIRLFNLNTGEFKQIALDSPFTAGAIAPDFTFIEWNPGSNVLYDVGTSSYGRTLFVERVMPSGSRRNLYLPHPGFDCYVKPRWSPDTKKIWYIAFNHSPQYAHDLRSATATAAFLYDTATEELKQMRLIPLVWTD